MAGPRTFPAAVFASPARLSSDLPYAGAVRFEALQPIERLALRIPDGSDLTQVRVRRPPGNTEIPVTMEGQYAIVSKINPGEKLELLFPLKQCETVERAAGVEYRVNWKGSSVVSISPSGTRVPLYSHRSAITNSAAPAHDGRYPL